MSAGSGDVNLRFTGETASLSAHVQKINRELRDLKRKMREVGDQSQTQTSKTNNVLLRWAQRVGAVTLAYQGLTRIVNAATQAIVKQEELMIAKAEKGVSIGQAQQQMFINLGYRASDEQRQDMIQFSKQISKDYNIGNVKVLGMLGGILSSSKANIEITKKAAVAIAPLARVQEDATPLGVMAGKLVSEGFTPEATRNILVALQERVHTTQIGALPKAMRGIAPALVIADTQDEKVRKKVIIEQMAAYATLTHAISDMEGAISGTGAAGLIMTAWKEFTKETAGKTPTQIQEWMSKSGAAQRLASQVESVYGEAGVKAPLISMLTGGEFYKKWQDDIEAISKWNNDQIKSFMASLNEGTPEIMAEHFSRGMEAATELSSASKAMENQLRANLVKFREETFVESPWKGGVAERLIGFERYMRGRDVDPFVAEKLFVRQMRLVQDSQAMSLLNVSHPAWSSLRASTTARYLGPEQEQAMQEIRARHAAGLPLLPGMSEQKDIIAREMLEHLYKWQKLDREKAAASPRTDPAGRSDAAQAKALMGMKGAEMQAGRHTERD